MVLVDLAAGVEFMGRASVQGIDAMIVVVEPGSRSIETAVNITRMAEKLGIQHVAAIINRVTDAQQIKFIKLQLKNLIVLASIEYSEAVQKADLSGESIFQADTELVRQLQRAKKALEDLV
jgi:CO dehydrogenase maturation factor